MPSLSEAPNGGAKRFGSFWAFAKGTRCKSETASRHNRSNGYAPNPKTLKVNNVTAIEQGFIAKAKV